MNMWFSCPLLQKDLPWENIHQRWKLMMKTFKCFMWEVPKKFEKNLKTKDENFWQNLSNVSCEFFQKKLKKFANVICKKEMSLKEIAKCPKNNKFGHVQNDMSKISDVSDKTCQHNWQVRKKKVSKNVEESKSQVLDMSKTWLFMWDLTLRSQKKIGSNFGNPEYLVNRHIEERLTPGRLHMSRNCI
jgi:hypothetical protein